MPTRRRRGPRWERRLLLVVLAGGLPGTVVASVWLARTPMESSLRLLLFLLLWLAWLVCAGLALERAVRPVQTIANMIAAIREGDTSIRARGADPESALGLALFEVNALTEAVQRQRIGAIAATALLQRVMDSVDVAVFGFDPEHRLRLVNGEGERLLGRPAERAIGLEAAWLGLGATLQGETPRLVELRLPSSGGRWELRRGAYVQEGRAHELVFLSDVSRALREEERQAWLRLIRVLSHEINNSLAPIQSIAASLRSQIQRAAGGAEVAAKPKASGATSADVPSGTRNRGATAPGPTGAPDLAEGLGIIEARAQALARFMHAYARLARLPKPTLAPLETETWVRRVAALEPRVPVEVLGGPAVRLSADGDQLDQLLINLVRNAADAALETRGRVWIEWSLADGALELRVHDEGPGIADMANLFVPFYTTKPEGTGIGLALSRQIAEAHGGMLTLENRGPDTKAGRRQGCTAVVRLPVAGGMSRHAPPLG